MFRNAVEAPTGSYPRRLTPNLLFTGGCLVVEYGGGLVHGSFCNYVLAGSEKTVLIDTGHAAHWSRLERDVEEFLDGRPLDYIFPTHCELPHAGLIAEWMNKYPDAIAVGHLDDFPLYYPELTHRMRNVSVGQALDLGDRKLVFIPPVWRDLCDTLWAYDTTDRVLFISDAFAYFHYHAAGYCDRLLSEQPLPDVKMLEFFNERAMLWTRYTDPELSFADMDRMIAALEPVLLATAHAGVIDTLDELLPLTKRGMYNTRIGSDRVAAVQGLQKIRDP